MPNFIILVHFTDQGIKNIKQFTEHHDQEGEQIGEKAFREMAEKLGATVKESYWTMGAYDAVLVVEAPDDATMTALALKVGSLGNVRTQTLRAYTREEMGKILAKV